MTGTYDSSPEHRKLVLADGVQISFYMNDSEEARTCTESLNGTNNQCAMIFTDINGAKKPNVIGRDVFWFVLKENRLEPRGCDYDFCTNEGIGLGCACKVLREGAMNY